MIDEKIYTQVSLLLAWIISFVGMILTASNSDMLFFVVTPIMLIIPIIGANEAKR